MGKSKLYPWIRSIMAVAHEQPTSPTQPLLQPQQHPPLLHPPPQPQPSPQQGTPATTPRMRPRKLAAVPLVGERLRECEQQDQQLQQQDKQRQLRNEQETLVLHSTQPLHTGALKRRQSAASAMTQQRKRIRWADEQEGQQEQQQVAAALNVGSAEEAGRADACEHAITVLIMWLLMEIADAAAEARA